MKNLKGNTKLFISLGAFVVVLLIIVAVLLIVGGRSDDGDSTTEPFSSIQEVTTESGTADQIDSPVVTTSPQSQGANSGNAVADTAETAQIEGFLSGSFYISGTMVDVSGGTTDMDMAISNNDFQVSLDMDGVEMSMLYLDGKLYMVKLQDKTYIEMSNAIMSMMGISIDDFSAMTESMDFSTINFTGVTVTNADIDGVAAKCYNYYNDNQSLNFYFIGGAMKRLETVDSSGNIASTLNINTFTSGIPSGMLTVSGYTKSSMMSFIGSLAE